MTQRLADLAGTDPVPLRLLELAEQYNDCQAPAGRERFLESCGAVENALIAVGRKGVTAAYCSFYVLAEEVDRWHQLDFEPQRKGIDHDMEKADGAVLSALFMLMTGCYPCGTALEAAGTSTVADLHATKRGWTTCGCERRISAA
jgi:hypothetical protein